MSALQLALDALEAARQAIESMKVEAETGGIGDEEMMLDACCQISQEGLRASLEIIDSVAQIKALEAVQVEPVAWEQIVMDLHAALGVTFGNDPYAVIKDLRLRETEDRLYTIQHPDDVAVIKFSLDMRNKMAASRAKGRSGWEDPAQCTRSYLSQLMAEHFVKGDPMDVGCLAMMLQQRGERIDAAPQPAPGLDRLRAINAELVAALQVLADLDCATKREVEIAAIARAAIEKATTS